MLSLRLPTLLPTFLFLTGVLASPVPAEKVVEVTKRQSDTYCGNNFYSASQVSEAVSVGCNYYQEGMFKRPDLVRVHMLIELFS